MRRGLIIFLAVMALIFSVVLCACENNNTTTEPDIDPVVEVTSLTTNTGIVIEGGSFTSDTELYVDEVKEEAVLNIISNRLSVFPELSVFKIYEFSLYKDGERIKNKQYLDFTIPAGAFRLQGYDLTKYKLYEYTQRGDISILRTNEGETKGYSFSTNMPLYFIVVKVDNTVEPESEQHQHYYDRVDHKAPSYINDGNIEYYYCCFCDKYFDEEYNEISKEDTVIPKLSTDLYLYVNGESKGIFSFSKDNYYLNWEMANVRLKANDEISLVFADDPTNTYSYTIVEDSNLTEEGKVFDDVDNATIKITQYGYYKYTLKMYVSGAVYTYKYLNYADNPTANADENGIVKFNNVRAFKEATCGFVKQCANWYAKRIEYEIGADSDPDLFYLPEKTEEYRYYHCYFNKSGYYNITIDTKTNEMNYEFIAEPKLEFKDGAMSYVTTDGRNIVHFVYPDRGMISEDFYATEGHNVFSLYNSSSSSYCNDSVITILEDSKKYIKFNNQTNKYEFLEYGQYKLEVDLFTAEMSVTKIADATPDYKLYIRNFDKYDLEATEDENILKINKVLYVGQYFWIANTKNEGTRLYKLAEASDSDYVIVQDRLIVRKAGLYNLYFNTSELKLDIELVRELSEDEILIPSYAYYKTYDEPRRTSSTPKVNFEVNPDDENELCLLNIKVWDCFGNSHRVDMYAEGYIIIGDTKLAESYSFVKLSTWFDNYGSLVFDHAGTYNIYINKTTHVVRVEEVVED